MTKSFSNISKLDDYVLGKVNGIVANVDYFCFLAGSFARGTESKFSDIDYQVCLSSLGNYTRFYFELIDLNGRVRLMSLFFSEYSELLIDRARVDAKTFLWKKQFMPNTRFVGGDRQQYDKTVEFYGNLTYEPKVGKINVHRSLGLMLEYLARVKKCNQENILAEMIFFGMKLAEHARLITFELNDPVSILSENDYLQAQLGYKKCPQDFTRLYLEINRYTNESMISTIYLDNCIELVKNTVGLLLSNISRLDEWTQQLLACEELEPFLTSKDK